MVDRAPRLTEADPLQPGTPGQPEEPAAPAEDTRAAAAAARVAINAVLKERAALIDTLDADLLRLIEQALGRVVGVLNSQPSDYQLWVLPRLVDSITRVAEQLAQEAAEKAGTAMGKAWTLGARAVDAPLGVAATPGGAAGLGTADLGQLRALQVMSTSQIKGASAAAVREINTELGQVVLGVQSPFDAQRKVAAVLTDRTASQIRGITTLSLGQAFNTSSFRKLQAQAARDPKIKKMWRRSGKLHARWNHDAIDGTVEEVNTPFSVQPGNKKGGPVKIMYPADPAAPIGETIHCGCVLIPWKASWGMLYKGAKPFTAAERKARGLDAKPGAAAPAAKKAARPQGTQATALAAFGATVDKPATFKDVTGQTVRVDAQLLPGTVPAALAALAKPGQADQAAYWAVQALRRPTEVWQSERVDMATGEVLQRRAFVKRFKAGGQAWQATATLRPEGGRWVAEEGLRFAPAPAAGPGQPAGVRVWPRRG